MTIDRAAIADRLTTTRARTHELFGALSDSDVTRAPNPIMSPPVWDLGHIAAYEELWVACRLAGHDPIHPQLQTAYDAFETPRARRTSIRLLDRVECEHYLAQVHERSLAALETVALHDADEALAFGGFAFDLAAQHEAQHTETVLQALQMFEDGSYVPPTWPAVTADDTSPPGRPTRIAIPDTTFTIGAADGTFAYDCERPAHHTTVAAFAIAPLPVSNAQYLDFIADEGYRRAEFWSDDGWSWRCEHNAQAPLYWCRDGEVWLARAFAQWRPVDPMLPVCHISYWEAEAFARWAGGRLPTEYEWECAAAGADVARARLDQVSCGPAPVGALPASVSTAGCEQMLGGVWEWTSSRFGGYRGFQAFPYPEYAEVFFGGDYRVLRGGSWATQSIVARTSFRNWDHPQRRQIFAGVRLAWDDAQ